VPPTASAGQYATLNCKSLQFGFPRKWQYINVETLTFIIVLLLMFCLCYAIVIVLSCTVFGI